MGKKFRFRPLWNNRLLTSFLKLLYPPLCLHCEASVANSSHPLCEGCLMLMDVIAPQERCYYCFAILGEGYSKICFSCRSRYPAYHRLASTFDYDGPASTLMKQMKYHDKPWLAEGIANFMYYQFLNLDWPTPDVVIPMPICWAHRITRGYNQSSLIADKLSEQIGCPLVDCLKRRSGDFSQAGKSMSQRKLLSRDCFKATKAQKLKDKVILLVDDVMTTGSTIEGCSEVLVECLPQKIYSLTFCRAVDR